MDFPISGVFIECAKAKPKYQNLLADHEMVAFNVHM